MVDRTLEGGVSAERAAPARRVERARARGVCRRVRAAWWFVVVFLVLGRILGWITVLVDTDSAEPVTES